MNSALCTRLRCSGGIIRHNYLKPSAQPRPLSSQKRVPSNPVTLTTRSCTVHLLGTMHIAEASAIAVRSLIAREHARGTLASIFLELDEDRYARLLKEETSSSPDESLLSHALSVLSQPGRQNVSTLLELGLRSMYRALHKLGFASGIEFRAAIKASKEHGNIPIVLGDQHIRVTMARLAHGVTQDFNLARMMNVLTMAAQGAAPFGKDREEMKFERELRSAFQAVAEGNFEAGQEQLSRLIDRDTVRKLIGPMREFAPTMTRAILDERDGVMASNLIKEAHKRPGKSIVAVVGLAHVDGIVERWNSVAD